MYPFSSLFPAQLLSSVLFGLSASLDTLIMGIGYGIKKVRVSFPQNLVISAIALAGTILSVALGGRAVPLLGSGAAKLAGSFLLFLMGGYYLHKFIQLNLKKWVLLYKNGRFSQNCEDAVCQVAHDCSTCAQAVTVRLPLPNPNQKCPPDSGERTQTAERGSFHTLTMKESAFLGVGLSVNNMGIGIGASIAGLHLWLGAAAAFLLSVCFLLVGNRIGKAKAFRIADQYGDVLSGILLIALGIHELL